MSKVDLAKITKGSDPLLEQAIELRKSLEQNSYKLGVVLNAIQKAELYKIKGYTSFSEYLKEDLDFHPSTGYMLASAAVMIDQYKLPEGVAYWKVWKLRRLMLKGTDRTELVRVLELPPGEFAEATSKPRKKRAQRKPPIAVTPVSSEPQAAPAGNLPYMLTDNQKMVFENAISKAIEIGAAETRESAIEIVAKFFMDYAEPPKEAVAQASSPIDYNRGDFSE